MVTVPVAASATTDSEVQPATTPKFADQSPAGAATVAGLAVPPAPEVDLRDGVPDVDAAAYVVYDVASNTVIAAHNEDAARPIASIVKLLSTSVALHAGPLDDPVTVPAMKVDSKESQIGLRAGETLDRGILVRAMLIVSANDAARALAIDVAGGEDEFVAQMNEMAATLELHDTVAKNPIGLDETGAHSTAADVLTLARYVMQDESVRIAVARRAARLHGNTYPATNKLLGKIDGVDGIKTGHTTAAGYCIVASATRDGRQVYAVILGAPTDQARTAAARKLFDWAFDQP